MIINHILSIRSAGEGLFLGSFQGGGGEGLFIYC